MRHPASDRRPPGTTSPAPGRLRVLAAAIVVSVSLGAGAGPTRAQATPTGSELAARIQSHYSSVRDFTADFTLTQTSGLLPKGIEERGHLKIKKPNRMRWTYSGADKKEFVSDGSQFYAYFPQDKYVDRRPLPAGNEGSTALLFLAGRGDLTRDFIASVPAAQPPGEWRLILTPKSPQAEFKTLTLEVARDTYSFRGMTVENEQGAIDRFRFTNLRENRGLADREFEFTIPRGVEIR